MPRILPLLFLSIAAASCGGSAPIMAPPPPPVENSPAGAPYIAAFLADGVVVRNDLATGEAMPIGSVRGRIVSRHPSPGGLSGFLVVVAGADSTRLVYVDPAARDARTIVAGPSPVVLTVAWGPDGSGFAYGHYRPITRDARPAMGEGDIRVVAGGVDRPAGCSASKAVLAWLPGGRLLVRDSDNLYVVDRDGCATRSTVDARRMHQLAASPDGAHIVYVHRELVYDRPTRQYVADSTFMVAGPDGSDARTVVGFRYRPARFAWRPDGAELAYDVENPDRPEQRLISIFDAAAGSSAYLHPPSPDGPSESDAHWSPDGSRILYRQDGMLAVRTFVDSFAEVLDGTLGADPVGWSGPDAVVVRLADGTARICPLNGGDAVDLDEGAEVLAVVPAR